MTQLKGFEFVKALVLVFKKIESEDKTKYDNFCSKSKAEMFINESDIDNLFQSIYTTIITKNFRKTFRPDYWSVIDHTVSISKFNSLAGRSYIELHKELDHSRKGLINIQNIDDKKCLKLCLVR